MLSHPNKMVASAERHTIPFCCINNHPKTGSVHTRSPRRLMSFKGIGRFFFFFLFFFFFEKLDKRAYHAAWGVLKGSFLVFCYFSLRIG